MGAWQVVWQGPGRLGKEPAKEAHHGRAELSCAVPGREGSSELLLGWGVEGQGDPHVGTCPFSALKRERFLTLVVPAGSGHFKT